MYKKTLHYEDELEERPLEEVKEYVRSFMDQHPDVDMVPAFFIYYDSEELSQYDGKYVRIIVNYDDAPYDGICTHNSAEYNDSELGRCEESLQLVTFTFYRSQIEEVISLEDNKGPYGRFLDPYGRLEEVVIECGIECIEEFLFCEDGEHVCRMLRCLDKYLDPQSGLEFPCREETLGLLKQLNETAGDERVRTETGHLIDKWDIS